MRLYVTFILFTACFFLSYVAFIITRFDASQVGIPDFPTRLYSNSHTSHWKVYDRSIQNDGSVRKVVVSSKKSRTISRITIKFTSLSSHVLFYSSFVDYRDGNMGYPCVRTVVIKQTHACMQLWCRFHEELVEGSLYELAENHLQSYGTYILNCKIPSSINIDDINEWILTDGNNSAVVRAAYRIPVETSIQSYQYDYGICVPFLYGSRYSGKHLIEFAELNKLLGAQRITIYTHKDSLPKDLRKALDHYSMQRLIEVVEYKPPTRRVWYFGQLITITDCLYRKGVPITLNNKKAWNRLDSHFTKCVVRPEMIFEQGIHHTSRVIQEHYKCEALPAAYATLHHYKHEVATRITFDSGIQPFRQQLNQSFQLAVDQIGL